MSLQQQYPPWLSPNPVQEKDPFCHVANPVHPYDKEPMFEKPLTPSDVGKLNRLVIPKLQAEKYFPLGGGGSAAASAGTLLGFEDEDGKEWRFRYSYWTSSQSYVLTKGWSRFVKDKRLLTGDVVCFERHRGNPARLFIAWRRPSASAHHPPPTLYNPDFCYNNGPTTTTSFLPFHHLYDDSLHTPPVAAEEVTGGGSSNSRRQVRLFGVNLDLECQLDNSPSSQTTSSSEASSFFSTTQQPQSSYHQHYYFDNNNYYYNPPPQHM